MFVFLYRCNYIYFYNSLILDGLNKEAESLILLDNVNIMYR